MARSMNELIEQLDLVGEYGEWARDLARRLRALNEFHVESDEHRCIGCFNEWPCSDRRILDGEEGA